METSVGVNIQRGEAGWMVRMGGAGLKGLRGHIRAAERSIPLYTRGGQPAGLTDLKNNSLQLSYREKELLSNTSTHQQGAPPAS